MTWNRRAWVDAHGEEEPDLPGYRRDCEHCIEVDTCVSRVILDEEGNPADLSNEPCGDFEFNRELVESFPESPYFDG